jgi:hypothetical protein
MIIRHERNFAFQIVILVSQPPHKKHNTSPKYKEHTHTRREHKAKPKT